MSKEVYGKDLFPYKLERAREELDNAILLYDNKLAHSFITLVCCLSGNFFRFRQQVSGDDHTYYALSGC